MLWISAEKVEITIQQTSAGISNNDLAFIQNLKRPIEGPLMSGIKKITEPGQSTRPG
jgi:hypothetical protein